jgi:hypothetical protein
MSMTNVDRDAVARLIAQREVSGLESFLAEHSNLPGPRANLALAAAVADLLPAGGLDWAVATVKTWSAIGPDRAKGNDPETILPFVAAQAAGELWVQSDARQQAALDTVLHDAANDSRWRVREGAAMALQRIGTTDFEALQVLLGRWADRSTLLEWRATVAGLAEPALIRPSGRAAYGFGVAMQAFDALMSVPTPNRKADDAQALRKSLGYALSVFLAADPSGFSRLEEMARVNDKDATWIVRET